MDTLDRSSEVRFSRRSDGMYDLTVDGHDLAQFTDAVSFEMEAREQWTFQMRVVAFDVFLESVPVGKKFDPLDPPLVLDAQNGTVTLGDLDLSHVCDAQKLADDWLAAERDKFGHLVDWTFKFWVEFNGPIFLAGQQFN